MDQNKVVIFEQFAKKAKERIEERKKLRKEELEISSIGMTMEIRGLSDAELNEVFEFSGDAIENDKYAIYYASSTLQEAAKVMVQEGSLQPGKEYTIADMFSQAERRFIAGRILEISGVNGDAGIRIKETAEVKNS
ncbi:MAG: hypothetical protein OSJ71_17200 [Acetatifactor sp.]|nr:hypothetical protein [Acetatifactor sp.]